MDEKSVDAHKEHLRFEQDHLKWSADHMRALAILKRAEACLYAHEAEVAAHRAEIVRHEEAIAHGEAHAPAPPEGDHEAHERQHAESGRHHDSFMKAIFELDKHF